MRYAGIANFGEWLWAANLIKAEGLLKVCFTSQLLTPTVLLKNGIILLQYVQKQTEFFMSMVKRLSEINMEQASTSPGVITSALAAR